jgi:subtilase family serine protease
VQYTPQNNHYVSAEGTVAQAAAAFGASFGMYRVDGLTVRSPSSNVSIPSSLAGIVSGVIGLDDSAQFVRTDSRAGDAPPPAAFVSASPCSTYWGQSQATGFTKPYGTGTLPYAPCGYTPQQVKGAHGISGYDGSGQTVAIIDAYAAPTLAPNQFTQVVAPPNNFQDLDAALNHVVDHHLASIVTNSYGFPTELLPPGYIKPQEDTITQGVIEGIGIYFSSRDNSDESQTVGYRTAGWPASSPLVTAVGGTSLAVGASNKYLFETGLGQHDFVLDRHRLVTQPAPGPGSMVRAAASVASSPNRRISRVSCPPRRDAPAARYPMSPRSVTPPPAT